MPVVIKGRRHLYFILNFINYEQQYLEKKTDAYV